MQALHHLKAHVRTSGGELPAALSALSGLRSLRLTGDSVQLPLAWCAAATALSMLGLEDVRLPPPAPGVPLFPNLQYLRVHCPQQDLGAAALASFTSVQKLSVQFAHISPHFWEASACLLCLLASPAAGRSMPVEMAWCC